MPHSSYGGRLPGNRVERYPTKVIALHQCCYSRRFLRIIRYVTNGRHRPLATLCLHCKCGQSRGIVGQVQVCDTLMSTCLGEPHHTKLIISSLTASRLEIGAEAHLLDGPRQGLPLDPGLMIVRFVTALKKTL